MFSLRFLTLLILLISTSSCIKQQFTAKKRPQIIVSIPPYVSLVKEIVGNTLTVASALDAHFDPHTSETTPFQIKKVQQANLFIGIGELYEKNLLKSVQKKRDLLILNMNERIPLLLDCKKGSFSHQDPPSAHLALHDPHFYLSPKLLVLQVKILVEILSCLSPQNTSDYVENGNQLMKKIESLDKELTEKLAPYKKRGVLVSHAALSYFCHDYDLIEIATEYEGKSPLPRQAQAIYQTAKDSHAICAFILPQFNNKGTEMIAQELNLRIESLNPLAENLLETIEKIGNDLTKSP